MPDTDTTRSVTARGAAFLAAEAVRTLNHLTRSPSAYTWPSDADSALASLATLAERLPQALEQTAHWLRAEADAGRVTRDDMLGPGQADDPGQGGIAVSMAELALEQARAEAAALAHSLREACKYTNHLRGVEREPKRAVQTVEYFPAEEGY